MRAVRRFPSLEGIQDGGVLCRFACVFLLPTSGCAGMSPRRASHFHLTRQMKVTKAKALSTRHSCVATGRDLSAPCTLVARNICCDFFPTRLAAHRREGEAEQMEPMRSEACLVFDSPFGRAEQHRALRERASARLNN